MLTTYRGVAHPWLCDVLGHMSARHYAAAFDDATWHLYAAIGIVPGAGTEQLWADVKATIEYVSSLAPGDVFSIESHFGAIGRTSLTAVHSLRKSDGHAIARQEVVSVQIDRATGRPAPVSDDVRARIGSIMSDEAAS